MFIVLEGLDGCGKSTHAGLLAEWLREKGSDVLLTAEPTGGPIGLLIREILSGKFGVDPKTMALLFTADRVEHTLEIRAALDLGRTVISDRYYYSTVAYQSAQGVDRKWLMELNKFALTPDLVVFLDVDPALGAARTKTNEIFERKEFLGKVNTEYSKFRRIQHVDSSKPKETVQEDIRALVSKLL
jgi:dTMP kinase